MAVLTPQEIPVAGGAVVATVTADPAGDEAPTGNGRLLYVRNTGGSSAQVTVTSTAQVSGLDVADVTAAVGAGAVWVLPLTPVFADATTTRAAVAYSPATGLAVAVLEPPA